MNKSISCNNCLKQGHLFHNCKLPITSYGIILFRNNPELGIQYLMIRRKDSFGYIDFIRGKYTYNNIEHLQKIINEMSVEEKNRINCENFETLWKLLWGENNKPQYRNDEIIAIKKFENIKNGITINNNLLTLCDLINNSNTQWKETEWEFPKGRRNLQENDLNCALREFEEETGFLQTNITIIENLIPFEEIYIGSNHKSYKHKYFLAHIDEIFCNDSLMENFQKTEVSKLEWKTINNCMESIRPYNLEKKRVIQNIHKVLNEYKLFHF